MIRFFPDDDLAACRRWSGGETGDVEPGLLPGDGLVLEADESLTTCLGDDLQQRGEFRGEADEIKTDDAFGLGHAHGCPGFGSGVVPALKYILSLVLIPQLEAVGLE